MSEYRPKHKIFDQEKFSKERSHLGGLAQEGMHTTGGTDIDWVIEHRGGFIVMENKTFSKDWIRLPVGQMITFEQMYKKLNVDGKCHFLIFGFENDVDFKNPETVSGYFDMEDWCNGKICPNRKISFKKFGVHRKEMVKITLNGYRKLMEEYWKEFEVNDSSEIRQNLVIQEIRKTHPSAYKPWTESDIKLLSRFWKDTSKKQSEHEKIHELSVRFGRNKGAIRSRLRKLRLLKN